MEIIKIAIFGIVVAIVCKVLNILEMREDIGALILGIKEDDPIKQIKI